MTREEFIRVLDEKRYSYEIVGDKIAVTYYGDVNLNSLRTLPPDVEFKNGGYVGLRSLETISPGVEFKNGDFVYLRSLIGGWLEDWSGSIEGIEGNIEGVDSKRLLNLMIKRGLFI